MPTPPAATTPFAASAISGHLDTRTAATEVAGDLFDHIGAECDLLVMFASFHHRAAFAEATEAIRQTLRPRQFVGVTAESVLGVDQELEGLAGLAALALRLPGLRAHAWSFRGDQDARLLSDPDALRRHIGDDDDLRCVVLLADPFSTPINRLLPALVGCRGQEHPVPIVGGMSSGASQAGHNALVLGNDVLTNGAAGVTLSGDLEVDIILSQGCRPIGKPVVVTKCQNNVILELGGKKALEVLQELAGELDERDRGLLSRGLLMGTVINEYKDRFGRGDFLVRNILGYDKEHGAMAVGDLPKMGQTIQFHVRDAETAHEDLQLLLDAQQLKPRPLGGLLFTCNGRGKRLFEDPHHDIAIIRERLGEIPLAGFFAAGEIGPIGNQSFVHGHTASLALLRA
jgi:small ligand-binding sensory domain FIST